MYPSLRSCACRRKTQQHPLIFNETPRGPVAAIKVETTELSDLCRTRHAAAADHIFKRSMQTQAQQTTQLEVTQWAK